MIADKHRMISLQYAGRALGASLILLLTPLTAYTADTQYLQSIADAHYHHVNSEIVGRGFHVYVNLPSGYAEAKDRHYPTVYLLDGGELFPMLAAYYRYLNFSEEMPDSIIVGISYGSDDYVHGNFRSSDYSAPSDKREDWGGAANYQSFLRQELLPMIESNYRADAGRRVIFGHSMGGQFVLFTALTDPGLFWGHVASNPALHRNLPFFLDASSPPKGATPARLFVSSGTLDDPLFRQPARQWIEFWNEQAAKPWQLKTMDLEGHTHMSAPPTAFRQGMRWLFAEE